MERGIPVATSQSSEPTQAHTTEPAPQENGAVLLPASPAVNDLQQREKDLMDFVENAVVAMHWVRGDGTILWANTAELEMLGYGPAEYIGHNIAEFHVDQPVVQAMLRRLQGHDKLERQPARMRRKDGSIRHVQVSSGVCREEGRFVHTRCITLDVTEQKKALESQNYLASIVESSDDAIISKDLDGIIRSWNRGAERLFGYKPEEIIGKHISTLAAPDRVDEIPDLLARLRRGERIDHYETKRRTKDGRVLTLSLTVSPICDSAGNVIGASKVARDITERERNQQELRAVNDALTRSNADLQQFVYSASHDLQEPLRMIAAYSELLKRDFGGKLGPVGDEYIGYTLEGAIRLEHLLRDLRAYTLVSTSGQEPAEAADSDQILDSALADLEGAIRDSGASITRTPLPPVRIHGFQMEQLFQNLIGNSIRYRGSDPPRIHVAAKRHGADWLFSVQDNGIGIDPEYKEQVFELFKRLHTASDYPGTGLGLAICQRIVQRARGRIWVESEPGRGATFFFTLPRGNDGQLEGGRENGVDTAGRR